MGKPMQNDNPSLLSKCFMEKMTEKEADVENFMDNFLVSVFGNLSIMDRILVESVCKKWQRLSRESWKNFKKLDFRLSTWTSATNLKDFIVIDETILAKVIKRSHKFLTAINFDDPAYEIRYYFCPSALFHILRICPNVSELQLLKFSFLLRANSSRTLLAPKEQCLRCLLKPCTLRSHKLSASLGPYAKRITKLTLNMTKYCDNKNEIVSLFKNMKKLTILHLCHFEEFLHNKSLLECIPFNNIKKIIFSNAYTVKKDLMNAVIAKLSNLESFSIIDVSSYNSGTIALKSLRHLTSLKNLKLKQMQVAEPDIEVRKIFSKLVSLEKLNVGGMRFVDDEFLDVLAKNCKNLRELKISYCVKVTDNGISSLASLEKLSVLTMAHLPNVINPPFHEIKKLKNLNCSFCRLLEVDFLTVIEQVPCFVKLTVDSKIFDEYIKKDKATIDQIVEKRNNSTKLNLKVI